MTPEEAARVEAAARTLASAERVDISATAAIGEAMDRRGVPLLRVILATASLLIIYVDPTEPDRNVPLTYGALVLYAVYSLAVYAVEVAWQRTLPKRSAHWLDVGWHTLLVSLSSGTGSLFFFYYYFDILVASFRCGAAEGLRVTAASAVLFTLVADLTEPATGFELNRFLLRPVSLLVLGYMIAYWGGLEERLKRRLALLEDVTVPSNPRFGVHQTLTAALEKLLTFYRARACLLVIADAGDGEHWLYQAQRGKSDVAPNPDLCPPELAALLLGVPFNLAVLARASGLRGWRDLRVLTSDVATGRPVRDVPASLPVVLAALDAPAIATVPFRYHHDAVGRLYVMGSAGTFESSDLAFLSSVMQATLRVTENIRLVDRLASDAAIGERRSLARSIHDTVVQPYIGLRLGLTAVLQRLRGGDRTVDGDLERLLGLIDPEMVRLREYMAGLHSTAGGDGAVMLSIRGLAARFAAVTGIGVTVEGPATLAMGDRLSAGLVQMVAEGLSNVRRHTLSRRAGVALTRVNGAVTLRIDNSANGVAAPSFEPRSLAEHARELGGTLTVHRSPETTMVEISIPL